MKAFVIDMSKVSDEDKANMLAWAYYWKGLGPRPIPVDHDAVKRVAKQIREMKS